MIHKSKIYVVAALLKNNHNQYLITQRLPDAHHGGKWEFPGGTVEEGESHRDALQREIKEELGISISVDEQFWRGSSEDDSKSIDISFYNCRMIPVNQEIKLIEIADYQWIDVSEFDQFEFPKSDTALIRILSNL